MGRIRFFGKIHGPDPVRLIPMPAHCTRRPLHPYPPGLPLPVTEPVYPCTLYLFSCTLYPFTRTLYPFTRSFFKFKFFQIFSVKKKSDRTARPPYPDRPAPRRYNRHGYKTGGAGFLKKKNRDDRPVVPVYPPCPARDPNPRADPGFSSEG